MDLRMLRWRALFYENRWQFQNPASGKQIRPASVNFPLLVQHGKEVLGLTDGFRGTEEENPLRLQAIVKNGHDPFLEFRTEVNEQIPAASKSSLVKGGSLIMLCTAKTTISRIDLRTRYYYPLSRTTVAGARRSRRLAMLAGKIPARAAFTRLRKCRYQISEC